MIRRSTHRYLGALAALVVFTLPLAACGDDDDDDATADSSSAATVPEGATLCGVANDDYFPLIDDPIAFGEDGWEERAQELVTVARILEQLAPAELSQQAADNVSYFEGQAAVESVSDFVPGSNEFNSHLRSDC